MANDLTGDFDVVAELAIPGVNRILAAMHQAERFLHSISVRLDDDPPPGTRVPGPTSAGSVDTFGDPIVDHRRIGTTVVFPGPSAATDPALSALGVIVNPDAFVAPPGTIVPSHLRGRAQMQLSPPTVDVPDASGTRVMTRLNVMARYFADPGTAPLAEFIRGDLQMTAAVNEIASTAANVVDIDLKADQVAIAFTPSWSSQPLSAEDLTGINLAIRNALKTSFLPSSATLPPDIKHIVFRALQSPASAIAVLLDLTGGAGTGAGYATVFLAGGDDFAFAVGIDYLRAALQPTIDAMLRQTYTTPPIAIDFVVTTAHVVYSISLKSGRLDLETGKIVLTVQGRATQITHKWYAPDFDFTARLTFTLAVSGSSATLAPIDVSLDTNDVRVNAFKDQFTPGIENARDQALAQSGANETVSNLLDANKNLGDFLNSLLTPPGPRRVIPLGRELQLAYTSPEIRPSGLILHGGVSVTDPRPVVTLGMGPPRSPAAGGWWPAPYVEFEPIPSSAPAHVGATGEVVPGGPDYSALKSWIPGGTIEQYEWSAEGQEAYPFSVDPHKFVLLHSGPAAIDAAASGPVTGYTPLCLTVRGSRISPSGPPVPQPVSASVCGYSRVPVIPSGIVSSLGGAVPMLALTRPGLAGQVEVAGHAPALVGDPRTGAPNLLVHLADAKSARQLNLLTQALRQSRRSDAPTAVVAIVAPDLFASAPYTPGVIYADNKDGSWERLFGGTSGRRPLTLVLGPTGELAWQHVGPVDPAALTAALAKHLVRGMPVPISMPRLFVRIGQPAPNFVFEISPGQELSLGKLAGRPVVLVFWKSLSQPSLEAARTLATPESAASGARTIVLAINDGERPDVARRAAAAAALAATVVIDPRRRISLAYGVTIWPTIVSIDASGLVTGIRYGQGEPAYPPSPGNQVMAAAR